MREWGNFNLIRELVTKDLKLRYSRPGLGFLWAFLSPFLMVLIFYLVFGIILKAKTDEAPFVLYLMSGVFPWLFFQESVIRSITSLMDNKNLIRESNFSHYLIPVSIVLAGFINFLPSLLILMLSSFVILKGASFLLWLTPFILALHFTITVALSIIVSILYVRWRDLKYFLDAILLLLFYLTPACYSLSVVKSSFPDILFKAYLYNPLVGILTLYRVALFKGFLSGAEQYIRVAHIFLIQILFAAIIYIIAFYLYKKNKGSISDYLSY